MKVKTSKTKPTNQSKQPRLIQKISLGILLFGLTFLMYFGYCWGWWGRNSLLMQYIFQCGCPISSNEFRYPEYVDVIIPACNYDEILLSPNGQFLYVEKRELWNKVGYFLNLQTGDKNLYTIPEGSKYFLTDDVLFLRLDYGRGLQGGEYILDRITGIRYPIQNLDTYVESETNVTHLLEKLRDAQSVFYIRSDSVIAIVENFQVFPENNFVVHYDIPGKDSDTKEKFLQDQNISYIKISSLLHINEDISPDGRLIALRDGVYLVETNQKIINGYPGIEPFDSYNGKYFLLYGWVYDSTGVIYARPSGLCMIDFWLPFMDGSSCLIEVLQPVLKLKIPQEYLKPSQ